MKKIPASEITEKIAEELIKANRYLCKDVDDAICKAYEVESSPASLEILKQLKENTKIAAETGVPLCQDTGMAVFFVEMGQDCEIEGGSFEEAVNEGVRKGYDEGYLRKSVCDPFSRVNTKDNTPAIIHTRIVEGDSLKISFMCKGGGSENMSRVTMLSPAQGWEGIKEYVVNRVAEAGPNPCPPIIVGLGIGGSFDNVAMLAKQALLRKVDDEHTDKKIADMEKELLSEINKLGIGSMGLGGDITCLGVKMATAPCHIASLPLAVNIQCHSSRHGEIIFEGR